jgi:MFS family permease
MNAIALRAEAEGAAAGEWPSISWIAKTALVANSIAGAIGFLGVGLVLPLMAHHFAATPGAGLLTQLVGGVVGGALAVSSPFVGRLIDAVGYRSVYLAGALLFAFFGAMPFLLDNLYLILLFRIGVGISMAAVLTAGYAGIGTLAPGIRARLMGLNALLGSAAAVILFPVLGALGKIGWRFAFLPSLATLILIPLGLALPQTRQLAVKAVASHGKGLGVPVSLLAIAILGGMLSFIGPNFSAFYLASIGITDPSRAAIPLTAMAFCSLLGAGLFAVLYARIGGTAVFALAMLLPGMGLIVAGSSHGLLVFALGGSLAGIGSAFLAPNLSVTAMSIVEPARVGRAVGLTTGAMFAAQTVVPFITEPLRQLAGAGSVFIVFGAVALAVGAGFVVVLIRRPSREPPLA